MYRNVVCEVVQDVVHLYLDDGVAPGSVRTVLPGG
jgi:hypothetical protein